MEGGVNEFGVCVVCKRGVDLWHEPQYVHRESDGAVVCMPCADAQNNDPSRPPWTPHMMHTIEPYILWRCNQAVNAAMMRLAEKYLEKSCVDAHS